MTKAKKTHSAVPIKPDIEEVKRSNAPNASEPADDADDVSEDASELDGSAHSVHSDNSAHSAHSNHSDQKHRHRKPQKKSRVNHTLASTVMLKEFDDYVAKNNCDGCDRGDGGGGGDGCGDGCGVDESNTIKFNAKIHQLENQHKTLETSYMHMETEMLMVYVLFLTLAPYLLYSGIKYDNHALVLIGIVLLLYTVTNLSMMME